MPVNGHVDLKTNLTPPLITHTAATPMPVPKLPGGGDPVLGSESRRGSSVSVDPAFYDKSPVRTSISLLQRPQSASRSISTREDLRESLAVDKCVRGSASRIICISAPP